MDQNYFLLIVNGNGFLIFEFLDQKKERWGNGQKKIWNGTGMVRHTLKIILIFFDNFMFIQILSFSSNPMSNGLSLN